MRHVEMKGLSCIEGAQREGEKGREKEEVAGWHLALGWVYSGLHQLVLPTDI